MGRPRFSISSSVISRINWPTVVISRMSGKREETGKGREGGAAGAAGTGGGEKDAEAAAGGRGRGTGFSRDRAGR